MTIKQFLQARTGNFAIITALAMVPVIGSMGLAVDYSRGYRAKSHLQDRADEVALYVARQGPTATDFAMNQFVIRTIEQETGLKNVSVQGSWTTVNEYTVDISGMLPLTMTQVLPNVPTQTKVAVQTVARYKEALRTYKPPTLTLLDPEAGDYNLVNAYCFNKDEKNNVKTKGRSQMVTVADNGGTKYSAPMPVCAPGETLSYQLHNVRNARGNPKNWLKKDLEQYDYFTDTQMMPGETYDLDGWPILETYLCPTLEICKKKNVGGMLPYLKPHNPHRETQPCEPGKFMYYGWEDRPPGRGSSDMDYDDIQLIVECPVVTFVGSNEARLIR